MSRMTDGSLIVNDTGKKPSTSPGRYMADAGDEIDPKNFTPLDGYILFERMEPETKAGKIFLVPRDPEKARYEATRARVVRVGYPRRLKTGVLVPPTLKEGETVVLVGFAGHDITLSGRRYVVAVEDDVLCALDGFL